jgi:transcriptional regulator of aromatic amino acid metabolism
MSDVRVAAKALAPTSEAELQALVNATPGVSLLIDLEGTIVCANQQSTTHFGIAMDQLLGAKPE